MEQNLETGTGLETDDLNKRLFVSKDGHIHCSKEQADMDDILFELNIPHNIEVPYPYDRNHNKFGKKRCDFQVDNVFVEYAGMLKHSDIGVRKKYEKVIDKKMKMCMDRGWNFVVLIPDTLDAMYKDIQHLFGGN